MTIVNFGGAGGDARSPGPFTSGPIGLPTGREMANGSTACLMRLRTILVAGYLGTRTGSASLGGSAASFTAPSASDPVSTTATGGWALVNGSADFLVISGLSGSLRVGRAGAGTTSYPGFNFAGTIGGSYEWVQAPTAPTLLGITQNGPTTAEVSWSAPANNGGIALTGYRIQYANNPAFTGAKILDVAAIVAGQPVTAAQITGLVPGSQVYARVAARNAVTAAAGSSSVYSASGSVFLVAEVGDLDGWEPYGALPAGLTPLVGDGLRRGTVYPLGTGAPSGLIREIQATGAGAVDAAELGIQRTVTGLTVGATYELAATGILLTAGVAADAYRLTVAGLGAGDTINVTTSPTPIPTFTFIATATEHTIGLQLNEAASWAADGWFEAIAFYELTLTEIPETSPYRLQDVVYEGPLDRHFSIACDTLGARWWVDRANVTQFRQADSQDAILAAFSDKRKPTNHEYTGIGVSFNTRDLINALKVTNHGRDAATGTAHDLDYAFDNDTSIETWGIRSSSVDMSLYVPPPLVNLIPSPSAESPTLGWTASTIRATVSRQTTVAKFGAYSFRAQCNTANPGIGIFPSSSTAAPYLIPVTAGKTYTFSFWTYTDLAGKTVSARIRWGSASAQIGTDTIETTALASSGWTYMTITAEAPAGAVSAAPWCAAEGGFAVGDAVYFDGILFHEGTAPADYFDGDTAENDLFSYAWNGEPHASSSTRTSKHLERRVAEILDASGVPARFIGSITWNAQEDPALGARLDIQSRIRVEFRDLVQDSRIVGITHEISATRWLITLELERSAP